MAESMPPPSKEAYEELGGELAKVLAGHHPGVQGPAIAHMVVIWLKQYPLEQRDRLLEGFIQVVRSSFTENPQRGGH